MRKSNPKRILVLVNPRSGLRWSFDCMRKAVDRVWDIAGNTVSYQFCQNREDGVAKARRAVEAGIDTLLVAGGDGTVNSIGRTLLGTSVELGIIPVGSGNGFARHFEIPLVPDKAVEALATAEVQAIDVGVVGEHTFLVTCSMAWEAALTESFARSPIRGVLPYVFASMQGYLEYKPQDFTVILDGGRELTFRKPLIFTIANLSQFGGGAKIAPEARADDGFLELVVALRQDVPTLIANLGRLFDGSISRVPQVTTHRFRSLVVRRAQAAQIQVDGDLFEAAEEIEVTVHPASLNVLVPKGTGKFAARRKAK
ncbi:MAG: diacylglycerol kinase family protein [Verrucomicrobia bacterium]|nr:diacylglycerol kinase family protein [Verrucomicrobiota bacterium]